MYAVSGIAVAPFLGLYPVFLMKLLCFAMFACAFNLLLGFTKMLSFGHAAYFGARLRGWRRRPWGGAIEGILSGCVSMLLGDRRVPSANQNIRSRYFVYSSASGGFHRQARAACKAFPGSIFRVIGLARSDHVPLRVGMFVGVFVLIRRIVHSPLARCSSDSLTSRARFPGIQGRSLSSAFVLSASLSGLAVPQGLVGFVTLSDEPGNSGGDSHDLLGGSGTLGPVVGNSS